MQLHPDPENVFFRCVEDSSEAIMISDPSGRLVYVNPAWTRTYGYSREEANGKTPSLLHSGLHSRAFYDQMWEEIRNPKKGFWKGELVNRCKDGALIPVLLTITPVKSAHGSLTGYMGVAVDIRFKRELESKVAHQDRLASIGLLASGIAHEIGTPLGVIRGRAEMIQTEELSSLAKKSLEVIVRQADRISHLIQSLLGFGRSFGELRMERLDPTTAIEDVLALVGQNIRTDLATVKFEVTPDTLIYADRSRLQHILLNLALNSTQAIKKAISQGRKGPHELKILAQGRSISVSDSGCGIEPGHLKEIFKPFFTTKDVGEGTGLGLTIVSQLATEIGAEISVESKVGVGTVFTLNCPQPL
ncbi:MAG: two-component system sensor histidine kinase NtrB [Oligoflexia bacterium]